MREILKNSNHEHSFSEGCNNEELIVDEKLDNDQEPNILTSMSRDGIRGPYGMDMNYVQDNNSNRFKAINSHIK